MDGVKQDKKLHVCQYEGCDARFSRPNRLEIHMRTHTGERPFGCQEPGCDKQYARQQHLSRHVSSAHERPLSATRQVFRCPVPECGRTLATRDTFVKHQRSHQRRPHCCPKCPRTFIKRQHLYRHEYEHTGIKPYACDRPGCDRRYSTPSHLRTHQRRHDHRYQCADCGLLVAKWRELVAHRRQLHQPAVRRHQCPHCDVALLSRSWLRVHVQIHAETRPVYACPLRDCPRYYYDDRNLTHHMRCSHQGVGHLCSVVTCRRKFSSRLNLEKHMLLHSGAPRTAAARRRPRRPRHDKGKPRGPSMSVFSQLTGQPDPAERCPQLQPAERQQLAAESEQLARLKLPSERGRVGIHLAPQLRCGCAV